LTHETDEVAVTGTTAETSTPTAAGTEPAAAAGAATQPSPTPTDLELTILMPCLNEAETLAICIRKARASLTELGIAGEVLIADNGSDDGSQDIARAEGARVVPIPRRGYGAALQGGIEAARGRFVLMADADDSYALDDIGGFVQALRGGADLVMGNRFQGGIAPGAMPPLHRYLGNPVLSLVGRLFFKIPVGDFHCGMRAFRKDKILALGMRTDGMEFASEMVVRASLNHLSITEVPTTLRPDGRSRAPHLRTWRDGWRHLRFLLLFSPRWLLLYPGLAVLLAGLVGLGVLGSGVVIPGQGRFAEGLLVAAGGLVIVGFQAVQFSLLARVFAATQRLLPPMRRNVSSMVDRLTLEAGLVAGIMLVLASIAGIVVSLVMSRTSDPLGTVAPAAFRLGTCAVVLGVLGFQVILGSTFLSILNLKRREATG